MSRNSELTLNVGGGISIDARIHVMFDFLVFFFFPFFQALHETTQKTRPAKEVKREEFEDGFHNVPTVNVCVVLSSTKS